MSIMSIGDQNILPEDFEIFDAYVERYNIDGRIWIDTSMSAEKVDEFEKDTEEFIRSLLSPEEPGSTTQQQSPSDDSPPQPPVPSPEVLMPPPPPRVQMPPTTPRLQMPPPPPQMQMPSPPPQPCDKQQLLSPPTKKDIDEMLSSVDDLFEILERELNVHHLERELQNPRAPEHQCLYCPEIFSSRTALRRHERKHDAMMCCFCGKFVHSRPNLKRHIMYFHGGANFEPYYHSFALPSF